MTAAARSKITRAAALMRERAAGGGGLPQRACRGGDERLTGRSRSQENRSH